MDMGIERIFKNGPGHRKNIQNWTLDRGIEKIIKKGQGHRKNIQKWTVA
jgi:hypothetical protein